MKRTEALSEILKVLANWEGSMLEIRTAKEIMDVIENKIKMQAPIWFEEVYDKQMMKTFTLPHQGWEPEPKLKRKGRKARK